ncbi:DUF748 domain-containing protein [Salinisphaera sp.]|uniref:DUF748 domain-containing protein n=1 Tax=Salinisphaera sp. TaxID=1914330 RepID=UPI000C3B8001|nr:DUF748 domain-containing protein [Salinisphaera sp.]MBS64476.1 hypothetical protein [Salinisphaera sp.]
MTFSRRTKGALVALCVVAVLVAAALVWLPSIVVRQLTLHYLDQAGMSARIGDVDVNLFTGTVVYEDAQASAAEGEQIAVGRLAITLEYAPLLSKRLVLTRLAIANSAVDIRRTEDNTLRVGGYPILADPNSTQSLNWGIAVKQLALSGIRLHYVQPAQGEQPAIDRELVLNDSSARDVVSWEQTNDVPMQADMSIGEGRIRLSGRITPFGDRIAGHLEVVTHRFALELIGPLATGGGLRELTGLVDSDQRIDFEYDADNALDVTIAGQTTGHGSTLAMDNGTRMRASQLGWQGDIQLQLLRAEGQPSTIASDGKIDAKGFKVANGDSLDFAQNAVHWQGKTQLTLAADATQLTLDGQYQSTGPQLKSGATTIAGEQLTWNGQFSGEFGANASQFGIDGSIDTASPRVSGSSFDVKTPGLNWQGKIDTALGEPMTVTTDGRLKTKPLSIDADSLQASTDALDWQGKLRVAGAGDIDSDGRLRSDRIALSSPDTLNMVFAAVDWQGKIDIDTAANTRVRSDGALDAAAWTFDVPQTALFETDDVSWRGQTDFDIGRLFARSARGRVIGKNATLDLPGQPIALRADRIVYNGAYSERPAGGQLKLNMDGDMVAQNFAVQNTALDAAWLSSRDTELFRLVVDGVDDIAFDSLNAKGVRMLDDTDSSVAVLQAISASARDFRLTDLAHYHVGELDIDEANIHIRRDDGGMGVMALYFGSDEQGSQPSSGGDGASGTASTYRIDHLSLAGPQIVFNDVSVTPNVSLRGSSLVFNVDGLDTGHPERDARFDLALDVGEYGHLDSRGTIAPLAEGGLSMDVDAWMRSLALEPLSGYLNAAMGRRIAKGVADGTLNLAAQGGQLDGNLDTTLSNFRLVDTPNQETEIILGISMDSALALMRGQSDTIQFQTAILGDVTNPYFSIRNLVREAVLAGLRTAVMSDYSPVGLLNKAKNAVLSLGRSLASEPVFFVADQEYIRPDERPYLARIAQQMSRKPRLRLAIQGHATAQDAKAMAPAGEAVITADNEAELRRLAQRRAKSVRDYLAARDAPPAHIELAEPVIDRDPDARPRATLSITGK